jgi:transcription antitermination protein NusB
MGVRRKAREAALQFLFQEDFGLDSAEHDAVTERFDLFCTLYQINHKARPYTFELLQETMRRRGRIDELISQAATNWRLHRIAATDRNLLRIAVCEMLAENDIPDQVAINEAVEIAKRFGSDDSPAFVNGVLDAIKVILRGESSS